MTDKKYTDEGKTVTVEAELTPPTNLIDPTLQYDSRLIQVTDMKKEVTVAPTSNARTAQEQLTLAKISGTYYLYVYFPDEGVYKKVTVS